MFHAAGAIAASFIPASSLSGFEPYSENHVETSLSEAHLEALSTYLDSTLIIDGLPGAPQRPSEAFPSDSPENMTHLTFYASDDDTRMSLLIDLKRDGHQLYVFNVQLPKDNNLLFRGAATAARAALHWHNEATAASNAETFLVRRAIESKLRHLPMTRPASMPDLVLADRPHESNHAARYGENHDVTHGMIHGVPHRLTRGLDHGVKRPYPW
jgi:hypothetical protein